MLLPRLVRNGARSRTEAGMRVDIVMPMNRCVVRWLVECRITIFDVIDIDRTELRLKLLYA
jgi:hypothetical protein